MKQEDHIIRLAEECLHMRGEIRPEVRWLAEVYDRFRSVHGGLAKAEADRILYDRIYGREASGPSGALKIRYWRTGQHMPVNRRDCMALARALELSLEESRFLIQGYYDRCDEVYRQEPSGDCGTYWERRKLMEELKREYLLRAKPERLIKRNREGDNLIRNFRHLYYVDAGLYISSDRSDGQKDRGISLSYHTELNRTMCLLGEIPRKTILRHLIILGMPCIDRERISEWLSRLGYLPLDEKHTLIGGEYLDWLLIRLLELYEECCEGKEPEERIRWFQAAGRVLDGYFKEQGVESLRFMNFKSLQKMV